MKDERLIATELTQYEPAEFSGDLSLLPDPVGDTVLIQPDSAATHVGKLGLIQVPEEMRDRYSKAAETGLILKVGDGAFTWTGDRARPWKGYTPQPGDRVWFKRYSGVVLKGYDGVIYNIMTDHCIGGVMKGEGLNNGRDRADASRGHSEEVGVGAEGQVSRA